MLRQLKLIGAVFMAGFALAVAYNTVGPKLHAFALHGEQIISTGNFDSSGAMTGISIPFSINTAPEFESFLYTLVHYGSSTGIPASNYNAYGAAFLIETMMHGQINYAANAALVTAAQNDYNTWKTYVDQYAATPGGIQWGVATTLPTGALNSTHVCVAVNGYCWGEAVYFNNNAHGGGYDAHSFQFYNISSPEPSTLIIFHNPDGTTFQIRHECANVVGSAKPLKPRGWALTGTTTSTLNAVYPGQMVKFTNTVKNTGPGAASFNWATRYCWDACPGGVASGYTDIDNGASSGLAAGSTMTAPTFSYTPTASPGHTKICVWIAYTNATGPSTPAKTSTMKCVNILSTTPSCGPINIVPSPIGPTDSYTIDSSVYVSGGVAAATTVNAVSNYYVHITGPGVNVNNNNVPVILPPTVGPGGTGTLATSFTPGPTNNVGTYTVTWGIVGPLGNINCGPETFEVAYTPFFAVMSGDVVAGTGFGNGSCSEDSADIKSWNNNTDRITNYFGAGSELGALASGDITNFVSGMGLTGGAGSQSGHGLSFANTGNGEANTPPNYGGGFGVGDLPCTADYYGTKATAGPTSEPSQLTPATLGGLASGNYTADPDPNPAINAVVLGNATHNPITIAAGKTVTLYVEGNVYIESNILYGAYTLATVPRFNLYVSGDIYIDPNVTELHGMYIAQASSTLGLNGNITTCADSAVATTEPYATCTKKLLVVGAVAAEGELRLARTHGNLVAVGATPAEPAETFQYSPELWLSSPPSSSSNIKAYTSLPPVF
ncbi:MAG TPA: hypothetical protein VLE99_06755 [Candidatus Saccharimonadales bacterium]|nr:hypothetical protein [Candidatus Saccharimonadales bacterium]